ncbi:tRNA 2-thiocytidine biosynthesis protein TtcA [Clostridiaceae bacterium HFYG-1003]|nr:tRNA 2-thiocytidine biosynthesis protein TtcA [Clostridiaceae bacterium HFYG-1003]
MDKLQGEGCEILIPKEERKEIRDVEASITGKYKKTIWSKFTKALNDFELIEPGDRIAVAISGGKDSMLMAKLFQELKRHRKFEFEVEFICMDPGYHPQIRELLLDNVEYLQIPLKIFEADIFQVIDDIARDYPCYMCARMRRGYLYAKARELGCSKLALGHHFNDVTETVMLNMVYGGTFKAMPPKLRSTNYPEIELIRPLYYIEEKFIKKWTSEMGIWPLNCACMVAAKRTGNKRYVIKELIEEMKKINPNAEMNILRSTQNVYRDTLLGYVSAGEKHDFATAYSERPGTPDEE